MNKISVRLCGRCYARFIVALLLCVVSLPSVAQFTDLTFESGREQYLSSDGTKILPKTIFRIKADDGTYFYDPSEDDTELHGHGLTTSQAGYPDGAYPFYSKVNAVINTGTAYINNNAHLWYYNANGDRVEVKFTVYRESGNGEYNNSWTIEPWEVSYFPSGVTVHLDFPFVYNVNDGTDVTKYYSSFEYEVVECAIVEKNSYSSAIGSSLTNAEAVIIKAPAVLTVNNELKVNQLIVEGGNEYTASGDNFCLSAGIVVSNAGKLTVTNDAWFLGPEKGGTKQIGWLINKGTYTSGESHFTRLIDNDSNFERARYFGSTFVKNSSNISYAQWQYFAIPTKTATENSNYRIAPRGLEWNNNNYGFVKPAISAGAGKSVSNVDFYSLAQDLSLSNYDAIKSFANATEGAALRTSDPTSPNYINTNTPLVVYKQSGTDERESSTSALHFSHSEINDASSYNYVATDQYENSNGTYSIIGSALYISNPYQAPIDWRAMAEGGVFDVDDVRNVTTQSFYGTASQTIYNVATGFTTYDGPMQYGYLQQPMSPAQLTTLAQDATPNVTVSKDYLTPYRNVRNKYVGTTTAKCDSWPYVRFYVDDVDNPNGVGNRNVFVAYFLTQSQYDQYITEGYNGSEAKEHYPYNTPSGNLMINSLYEAKIAAGIMSDQFYANVPYIGAATQTEGETDAVSERYPTVIKAVVYDESNDNVDPNCDVWFYIATGEKNVEYGILDYGNIKSSGIGVKLGDLRLNVYEDGTLLSDITSANFDVSTGRNGKALTINSNKDVTRVRLGNIETTVSSKTPNQYSIEFVDDDEITVLKESTLYTSGTLAADVVKPADPTKEADAQYTYEFTGWSPVIADVTRNATYTATYAATLRKYKVTFVDADGTTVLDAASYDFGTSASDIVLPTDPVKAADDQYTYEFAGWDVAIEDVYGDATYTATYTPTLRQYQVTFVDEDGTTILKDATSYDYGTLVADIETPANPTKAADAQYTYEFAGWTPAIEPVTADATYTATYSGTLNKYTVTFYDEDGVTVLEKDENVEYGLMPSYDGTTPTKPADTQHKYAFNGWSPELAAVTGDASYVAQFEESANTYVVSFVNGTTTLQTEELEYGEMPVYKGATPTKASSAKYIYTFKEWLPAIAEVTAPATYEAQFDSVANTNYLVVFRSTKGDTISAKYYAYGDIIDVPEAPVKESNAQNTYTFVGWFDGTTPLSTTVTKSVTYVAQYSTSENVYRVSFYDYDGTTISSELYNYGSSVVVPATPTRTSTEKYDYKFKGWDHSVQVKVYKASEYTAVYDSSLVEYNVYFVSDVDTVQNTPFKYGEMPVYTKATPTKNPTAQYSYTFKEWTPALDTVKTEATYVALFDSTTNSYEVAFVNGAETLQTDVLEYGVMPVYKGEEPIRAATAQYSFTFKGWSPDVVAVDRAVTYEAVFDTTVNKYNVYFLNAADTLQTITLEYGATPEYTGAVPAKAATDNYTYTFAGWTPEVETVIADAAYVAKFDSTEITKTKYLITFMNGNEKVQESEVAEGEMPVCATTPTKAKTQEYIYEFVGWMPEVVAATADATYYAQFDSTEIANAKYVITFKNGDDILQVDTLLAGTMPSYNGAMPTKAAEGSTTYVFIGWTPEIDTVYANETYEATFDAVIAGAQKYLITFVSEGEILRADSVVAGALPYYEGVPTKNASENYTYKFAGWTPDIVNATADAIYTARFDSTLIEKTKYLITFINGDEKVQESEVEEGEMPVCEKMPTKANTEEYVYAFKGWKPEVVKAIENATYYAQFDSIEASKADSTYFIVTFVNGSLVVYEDSVKFGETPAYKGKEPAKASTADYEYKFIGWEPEFLPATAPATYVAQFEEIPIIRNKYTITFMNGDEKVQEGEVEEGEMPACATIPTKANSEAYVYAFTGWKPEVVKAIENATYYAQFDSMEVAKADTMKFVISFANDTVMLQTDTLKYGEVPVFRGDDPTKKATAKYEFTFAGWDPMVVGVTKDVTYKAVFDTTEIIIEGCKAEINENAASVIFDKWILTVNNLAISDSIATVEWYKVVDEQDDWCDGTRADDVPLAAGKYFTGDSVLTKFVDAKVYAVIKLAEPRNGIEYIISNIIDLTNTTVIAVAPTQARHGQTIRVLGLPSEDAVIRVYNLYGTMVKNIKTNGDQVVTFEAEDSDGIYIVNVKAGNYTKSVKYIVK
ncbi:MAG: T9SS type A sorting domain-containing protein [Bacteroidales bacterium]|nr:T9SS type A sorting domain-containing protein [Bacteroidales bacterium]